MAENGYYGVHEKLVERYGRAGDALYTFIACVLALVVSGLAAYLTKQPLLFPSLGPATLLFFEQPMSAGSSPRNTLMGHLVAARHQVLRKTDSARQEVPTRGQRNAVSFATL